MIFEKKSGRARRSRRLKLPIPVPAAVAAALAVIAAPFLTAGAATQAVASTPMWSTQLMWDNHGTAWSAASFAALKARGLTTAEIDVPWNTVEPALGRFIYTELDQELANAAAAGIRLVPIFWYSGWSGSPASWVTSHEVSITGAQSATPAWWDPTAEPAYLTYVTDTVKHIAGEPGYGGSILDYGQPRPLHQHRHDRGSTRTTGNNGAHLQVQNDGNVVIYSATGTALWSTGTAGK
jgi:hypothetical protein